MTEASCTRELWEETGLKITNISGEEESIVLESNGYKVLNYTPFSCSQNIQGTYPMHVTTLEKYLKMKLK